MGVCATRSCSTRSKLLSGTEIQITEQGSSTEYCDAACPRRRESAMRRAARKLDALIGPKCARKPGRRARKDLLTPPAATSPYSCFMRVLGRGAGIWCVHAECSWPGRCGIQNKPALQLVQPVTKSSRLLEIEPPRGFAHLALQFGQKGLHLFR